MIDDSASCMLAPIAPESLRSSTQCCAKATEHALTDSLKRHSRHVQVVTSRWT
jgi:hypothetical protein